ncbi:MAG: Rpn family recombination-promoting nuclease/putative transposase [Eubacterium sp.]|nr:Rpn family recombination-promoting nuclease/putative transposase [Eubacterium sp.]
MRKKEEKRYEITNSLMFAAVMSNKEICKKFIERIIPEKKVKAVEIHSEIKSYVETEKTIVINPAIKAVRLDVLFVGEEEWINIEMQMVSEEHQSLRGRCYDATMTVQQIRAGDKYSQLKTNYVIFINPFDYYGKGEAIYKFYNMEEKYGRDLPYGDKTYKIVVCTENFEKAESEELKSLLKYLYNGVINEDDSFVCELDDVVEEMNSPDNIWRESIMTIEEMMDYKYREGKQEGEEKGKNDEKRKTAIKMKELNIDIKVISEVTGLSKEKIEKL